MNPRKWSESEIEYGRKILASGLEGARLGEEAFLEGRPLRPFLSDSARRALTPAAVGACLGALSSLSGNRKRSIGRTLFFGLLGGAIGFAAGMTWESRGLTESAANGAWRNIHKVRDEHWVEKHPVAYA
jgi:hypothetical protein